MINILFRGQDLRTKQWHFGDVCTRNPHAGLTAGDTPHIFNREYKVWVPVKEATVGQWTGLYDATQWSNNPVSLTEEEKALWHLKARLGSEWAGKPIFQHDTLLLLPKLLRRFSVYRGDGAWTTTEEIDYPLTQQFIYENNIVIVGNIHDNPGLEFNLDGISYDHTH